MVRCVQAGKHWNMQFSQIKGSVWGSSHFWKHESAQNKYSVMISPHTAQIQACVASSYPWSPRSLVLAQLSSFTAVPTECDEKFTLVFHSLTSCLNDPYPSFPLFCHSLLSCPLSPCFLDPWAACHGDLSSSVSPPHGKHPSLQGDGGLYAQLLFWPRHRSLPSFPYPHQPSCRCWGGGNRTKFQKKTNKRKNPISVINKR